MSTMGLNFESKNGLCGLVGSTKRALCIMCSGGLPSPNQENKYLGSEANLHIRVNRLCLLLSQRPFRPSHRSETSFPTYHTSPSCTLQLIQLNFPNLY